MKYNNIIKTHYKNILVGAGIAFISTLLAYILLDIRHSDLQVPLGYIGHGDDIFVSYVVKTIGDFGSLYQNHSVGMPIGGNLYDFPFYGDSLHLLMLKILVMISGSYGMAINIFYLSLFPVTTLISYYCMRALKINPYLSVLGSLVFAFLPYRFLRATMHLFLSAYTLIPVGILILIWFYSEEEFFVINKSFFKRPKNLITLISLILTGISGMYYSFFLCFLIVVVMIARILKGHNIMLTLKKGAAIIVSITLTIACFLLPVVFQTQKLGANIEKPTRSYIEAEIYGMKITQLYLPNNTNGIKLLEKLHQRYAGAPLPNEGSEYLGIIGCIGFTILILLLFHKSNKSDKYSMQLEILKQMNIATILLATIGGFGSIFALIVSPQIRAYNRISVYIAYMSILAVCIILNKSMTKWKYKKLTYTVLGVIFLVSVIEQKANVPNHAFTQALYYSDKEFVQHIENNVSEKAMIFQLPYFKFPENPPQNNMHDYSLFRGYLHSDRLRWSYGGYKGREADQWNRYITSLPLEDMIKNISLAGFEGIYINRYAYTETELLELEHRLEDLLKVTPYISRNNELIFFNMKEYNKEVLNQYSLQELIHIKEVITSTIPAFNEGFYGVEGNYESKWLWGNNTAIVNLKNISPERKEVFFRFNAFTAHEEDYVLTIFHDDKNWDYSINNKGTEIGLRLQLNPGDNKVTIQTDSPAANVPGDNRALHFRIDEVQISHVKTN